MDLLRGRVAGTSQRVGRLSPPELSPEEQQQLRISKLTLEREAAEEKRWREQARPLLSSEELAEMVEARKAKK